MKTSTIRMIVAMALTAVIAACGGGGGGSTTTGTGTTTLPTTGSTTITGGIAGVAGSNCAVVSTMQSVVNDLDNLGFAYWAGLNVTCTTPGASAGQQIAGLPASAFTFTGNGVLSTGAEDMTPATSSTTGSAVYVVQNYRRTATAAGTETVTVSGTDSAGRAITATGIVNVPAPGILKQPDLNSAAVIGLARTIDSTAKGYTGTFYVVPSLYTGSATLACNTTMPVIDTTLTTGIATPGHICYYTTIGVSNPLVLGQANWSLNNGTGKLTDNTTPTLVVTAATFETPTGNSTRTPVYKITFTVQYPTLPAATLVASEGGTAPWLRMITPMSLGVPPIAGLAVYNSMSWLLLN